MNSSSKLLLSAFGLLCCFGCGSGGSFPTTYPVTGVVKVKGKPIEGAIVAFQLDSGKENAIGTTNSTGEFKLSMFRPSDGAIPGQYRVAISKVSAAEIASDTLPAGQLASGDLPDDYAPPADAGQTAPQAAKSEIPEKYANDKTSGLRATVVESSDNHFEFDLE